MDRVDEISLQPTSTIASRVVGADFHIPREARIY